MNENLELAVVELLHDLNEGRIKRIKVRSIKPYTGYRRVYKPHRYQLLVDRVHNIEIRIWNNDHPPPHFHAILNSHFDVRVDIETSTVLSVKDGKIRSKHKKMIESWAEDNKHLLRTKWEETRPTEIYATANR